MTSYKKRIAIKTIVLYKLPHSQHYTRIISEQEALPLTSIHDVPLNGGYVVAPFVTTDQSPLLFIKPTEVCDLKLKLPDLSARSSTSHLTTNEAEERLHYTQAFQFIKGQLIKGGALQKVVLSRRLNLTGLEYNNAETLFFRACHYRPNNFVVYWSTPQTGQWLVATPEPLLEVCHHQCSTVALAGTLPWTEGKAPKWNNKNREEQAIVARYIQAHLEACATNVKASNTYSFHTGNIQHLRTDFAFTLQNDNQITEVLQRLHPTPAVCGLPRDEALQAILKAEHSPRRYYAGFSGPLLLNGDTHLYVTLRCMHFSAHSATLYAGGGIMPESQEAEEWEETQRKLATMMFIL